MDYQVYISTPKETQENSPLETTIHLTKGKISGGWVYFPYGPAGVLHLQLFRGGEQIAPANRGKSYNLDDAVIPLSLELDLDEPPFIITAKTWNTSTTYDHSLNLALFLREEKRPPPGTQQRGIDQRAKELIEEIKQGIK